MKAIKVPFSRGNMATSVQANGIQVALQDDAHFHDPWSRESNSANNTTNPVDALTNACSIATSAKASSPLGPSNASDAGNASACIPAATCKANESSFSTQVPTTSNIVQSNVISSNSYGSAVSEVITVNEMRKWNEISPRVSFDGPIGVGEKVHASCPFPADDSVNRRIALYSGDITKLAVNAIVNTTNESFSDRTSYSLRILSSAGPQLKEYIREHIKTCRTGDAKITPAFNLPAKYIIHSVGPKYNEKYRTAAEGALYSAYSKVLQLAREHGIRTLALCPINCVRRGYPPHDGAHMALRVVRRALEKHKESFTLIIFVVEDVDVGIYDHLMPFYFPRSHAEEESAQYYLPEDIGGDTGQPLLPERRIRIAVRPTVSLCAKGEEGDMINESIDLTSGLNCSVAIGKSSFARMTPDVDKRRQSSSKRSRSSSDPLSVFAARSTRYERILRSVKLMDFKELDDIRFIYIATHDANSPVFVVILGYKIPFSTFDPDYLLHYLVHKMDSIASKSYSIIYLHSLTTPDNLPTMAWINTLFNTLPEKYLYNLTAFYIVHSNFWVKVYTWWFTTFHEGSLIKHKIIHLGGVQYLAGMIPLAKLALPQAVMDYDFKVT